jgi:hypothetical protein
VRGTYRFQQGVVSLWVDKPIGVPWGPIERAMERFFEGPPSNSSAHDSPNDETKRSTE